MRRGSIFGVLVATVAVLALAGNVGAASTEIPFTQTFVNPCTGEELVATGTLLLSEEVTVASDGSVHEHSHMSFKETTATAPISRRKYIVQEQTVEGSNSSSDGTHLTIHSRIKVHWVRTGETGALIDDDDFYDWFLMHLTVNVNGAPSLKIDTEDDVCR